jgi:hypothetical protein
VLSWNPDHSFGLEATGNVNAGVDEDVLEVASVAAGS